VDVAAAVQAGAIVTNTPGVLVDETADLALGLLLATIRQIPQAERHLRAGLWPQERFRLSPSLRGRRVGILGLGAIGKAIARRLEGFGWISPTTGAPGSQAWITVASGRRRAGPSA
jgi:lactate dehydrogenase-like 2-hydroxyacid dehydrogenase